VANQENRFGAMPFRKCGMAFLFFLFPNFEKKLMNSLYKFKWPLIIISIGLILENFVSMATIKGNPEDYVQPLYIIGILLKMLGLLGLAWKLLFIEK
jgi:hypothetical protein